MSYKDIVDKQRNFFLTDITKSYHFRLKALKQLKQLVILNEEKIYQALKLDLNKSKNESFLTEVNIVLNELNFHIKNLRKLMKIKKVKTPITIFPAKSYLYSEPYGNVLIISPWNYPFLLAINPLIGAIAAGNTIIIKPSEHASNTANLINELIKKYFDPSYIFVVCGDVHETTKLLENKFEYLFFTGSPAVGKILMKKMSATLTPLTLELGGKSPALVTSNVNVSLVAKRIAYGKTINAGQTCIAPDYLLIEENILNDFLIEYKKHINSFYGSALLSDYYPKIINTKHLNRLKDLLKDEEILFGGNYTFDKLEPTLVLIKDLDSPLMKEEIFGPILPIVTYKDINEAFSIILSKEKPLSAYLFTNEKLIKEEFVKKISAGGIVINDTLMHFANIYLPFGGIGNSGMGKYHGKKSFETFSHAKAIVDRKTYLDVKLRYHPISDKSIKIVKKINK